MEDLLEDSEILYSRRGRKAVARTSEQISLCLRLIVSRSLLLFIFHICEIIYLAIYNCFYFIIFITGLYSSQ